MPNNVCLLSDLTPGDSAIITSISEEAPDAVRRRLNDLGFAPGTPITMTRRAPMGDPGMLRRRDFNICRTTRQAVQLHLNATTRP